LATALLDPQPGDCRHDGCSDRPVRGESLCAAHLGWGRPPVEVPMDDDKLAEVCAILRDVGVLPSVAAEHGIPVRELEELAARHEPGEFG
jgi:hypothetical protein